MGILLQSLFHYIKIFCCWEMSCQNINFKMWQSLINGSVYIMFGLAERGNLYSNLIDSIKTVISLHRMLIIKTSLLIPFLSNGVEGSILMSFFSVNFIDKVSDDLSIILINVDNDVEDRMILSYYHKNCDHFINHLLNLMNLILKLNENINILHGWLLKNSLSQW